MYKKDLSDLEKKRHLKVLIMKFSLNCVLAACLSFDWVSSYKLVKSLRFLRSVFVESLQRNLVCLINEPSVLGFWIVASLEPFKPSVYLYTLFWVLKGIETNHKMTTEDFITNLVWVKC